MFSEREREKERPSVSIFQDRGVDPAAGSTDRTTDALGARNRIATDPGQVRGVRQTAGPRAHKDAFYTLGASAVLRTARVRVWTGARCVYERYAAAAGAREEEAEVVREIERERTRGTEGERDEARRASSRRMKRDNDGRIEIRRVRETRREARRGEASLSSLALRPHIS